MPPPGMAPPGMPPPAIQSGMITHHPLAQHPGFPQGMPMAGPPARPPPAMQGAQPASQGVGFVCSSHCNAFPSLMEQRLLLRGMEGLNQGCSRQQRLHVAGFSGGVGVKRGRTVLLIRVSSMGGARLRLPLFPREYSRYHHDYSFNITKRK